MSAKIALVHQASCHLTWDGKTFVQPPLTGTPRPDQMQSTEMDKLIEFAGRTCYDSVGSPKSRGSADYHKHINEVGHHSTHEHAGFTMEFPMPSWEALGNFALICLNRPGVHVTYDPHRLTPDPIARISVNLRSVRDWASMTMPGERDNPMVARVGWDLACMASILAPLACGDLVSHGPSWQGHRPPHIAGIPASGWGVLGEPVDDEEVWACIYLEGVSRGLTHELVRHKFRTSISQRSTRYVDESESPWVVHPLANFPDLANLDSVPEYHAVRSAACEGYDKMVVALTRLMIAKGMDATTARKQARGAARGLLGNALETKLVFGASIAQWKRMLKARMSNPADAEIRLAFNQIYGILRTSFPERFPACHWKTEPAKDGMGLVLA